MARDLRLGFLDPPARLLSENGLKRERYEQRNDGCERDRDEYVV